MPPKLFVMRGGDPMRGVPNPEKFGTRWFRYYDPLAETMSEGEWLRVQEWVWSEMALLAVPYGTVGHIFVRVLAKLALFSLNAGMSLSDTDRVLGKANVESFCATPGNIRFRSNDRTRARQLGRLLTGPAGGWEPRPPVLTRRGVATPYTNDNMADFEAMAPNMRTARQSQVVSAFYLLSGGFGLRGSENARIKPTHFDSVRGYTVCRVPAHPTSGKGRRLAVLRKEFQPFFNRFVPTIETPYVIATASQRPDGRARALENVTMPPGLPRLAANRLRSTWLLRHLDDGTRLAELAKAADLDTVTVLSDLLPDLERLDTDGYLAQLRGNGRRSPGSRT